MHAGPAVNNKFASFIFSRRLLSLRLLSWLRGWDMLTRWLCKHTWKVHPRRRTTWWQPGQVDASQGVTARKGTFSWSELCFDVFWQTGAIIRGALSLPPTVRRPRWPKDKPYEPNIHLVLVFPTDVILFQSICYCWRDGNFFGKTWKHTMTREDMDTPHSVGECEICGFIVFCGVFRWCSILFSNEFTFFYTIINYPMKIENWIKYNKFEWIENVHFCWVFKSFLIKNVPKWK